jgi:hypothetical protein
VALGVQLAGVELLAALEAGQPALGVVAAGLVVAVGRRAVV